MRVILTVTEGPHQGRAFQFDGHDTLIVGRAPCAHFRLTEKDKFFSRVHFMVEVNPPHCRLMDLGSRNGTVVNGQKVTTADLKDGDSIRGGKTALSVSIRDHAAVPAPDAQPVSNVSDMPTIDPPKPPLLPETVNYAPSDEACDVKVIAPEIARRSVTTCRLCGSEFADTKVEADATPVSRVARRGLVCAACQAAIDQQPQTISGYKIVRELGRGGMGAVNLAMRGGDGELVAIKTILPAVTPTKRDLEKFMREARILGELDHPNIVAFREMGQADDRLYFVMDYVRGRDAARLVREHGRPLPVDRAVRLVSQMLQALDYAHAKQFVHRDIKPQNLLVTETNGGESAKLADFGLARTYQAARISGLTMMGHYGGTVEFMAPEQLTNFRDARPPVDIYAAGATLYTLLTGHYVYDFPDNTSRKVAMLLQTNPRPIRSRWPELPEELGAIIDRSLARDPAARFSDAKSMRRALLKFSA